MIRKTIKFKLLVVGISAALIPMLIVGLFSIHKTSTALEVISKQQSVTLAENVANTIDIILNEEIKIARTMAISNYVIEAAHLIMLLGKEASAREIIGVIKFLGLAMERTGKNYEGIFVTDLEGQIYADGSGKGLFKDMSVAEQAYFKQAVKGNNYVGSLTKSLLGDQLIFPVSVPIYTKDQELGGALVVFIRSEFISKRINEVKIGDTGFSFLIDRSGLVQAHPVSEMVNKVNMSDIPEMSGVLDKMLASETGAGDYTLEGEEYISGFSPVLISNWSVGTKQLKREALATSITIRNTMVLVMLAALVIVVFTMVFLARSIIEPIKAAVRGLHDIASGEGDLTMRLKLKNNDEVGELAHWFNLFIEKLQAIIKQLSINSNDMAEHASKLLSISTQFNENAQNASDQSSGVAGSANQMSGHMKDVAASMNSVTNNTSIVASGSEEMSITISEISQNAEQGRHISESASKQALEAVNEIQHLDQAAKEIGSVTEAIIEISEQTNLLALNATIEAARAGEAGKGFAVVANEIKSLSHKTASASQDIKMQIEKIQNATKSTVVSMKEIEVVINDTKDIVSTIASSVEEQSVTANEITKNIAQISESILGTNEIISNSSLESESISTHIGKVTVAVEDISGSSNMVKTSADDLQKIALNQSEIVGRFRI